MTVLRTQTGACHSAWARACIDIRNRIGESLSVYIVPWSVVQSAFELFQDQIKPSP